MFAPIAKNIGGNVRDLFAACCTNKRCSMAVQQSGYAVLSQTFSFLVSLPFTPNGCDRCPVPGDVQGQAGQGSEQPDLAMHVPVHCRGVELGDL